MIKKKTISNVQRKESTSTEKEKEEEEEEEDLELEWEMRPGGMLVQIKRTDNSSSIAPANIPTIRVRVVYGSIRYDISVNSQATFGELKKLLTVESGLRSCEQRLVFRGKDRENWEYLDRCGVKNRSKIILTEDPLSKEKRIIEMRRNAKLMSFRRAISDVSVDIDKLSEQVSGIEKLIGNGKKVAEVQITTLTEMLMRQAVKLDSIPFPPQPQPDEQACALKVFQEKRVQKCVETLDVLKESNSRIKPVAVVTTRWETFDPPLSTSHWELFD